MRSPVVLMGVLACGGGDAPASLALPDSAPSPADSASAQVQIPDPVRGRLVADPVGSVGLGGSWRARAQTCEEPRSLQIMTEGDSIDLLLVLFLPDSAAAEREYPILQSDSVPATGWPPHARIGVQRVGGMVSSYQGTGGTVWLDRLDRTASGRFDVVLREALNWDTLRYLGTFGDLPVRRATPEICGAPAGR